MPVWQRLATVAVIIGAPALFLMVMVNTSRGAGMPHPSPRVKRMYEVREERQSLRGM